MDGQVVVVTGGGRGIGRAICRRFAAAGARVVAAARSTQQLNETRSIIEAEGGQCSTIPTDVTNPDDVSAMTQFAVDSFGRLDILVNNAGVAPNAPIESFDLDVFDAMQRVNINGVFFACRSVWPVMRKAGHGIIVNISSVAAIDPFPGFGLYGATKAFVEALTRGLAAEGREFGIRVHAIGPGAVDTQMLRGPFPDFPADQCLSPEQIAESVYTTTLAGNEYAVGQTLYVRK
jgi:NAD(P)-dependent dehydrogenase (short-subunit alcohol dehydrogenase family)